jgi:hypothetical protein
MFEHAAYLAVLAFAEAHLDPAVAAGAAFEICVDLAVADAIYLDTVDEILQLGLADVAEYARAIGAFHTRGRQFQLALQLTVGRK